MRAEPGTPRSLAVRTRSLATGKALKALEDMVSRSAGIIIRRRNKPRLIIDADSTKDPVHGNQEGAAFNGYFQRVCYHPLFCFTSKGDLFGAKLRPGNAHSADGAVDLVTSFVERYRPWFRQFWLRGDAAFAGPDLYLFCEQKRVNYFIRISTNDSLKKLIHPHPKRPAVRPPKTGVQVRMIAFDYQAER